MMKVDPTEFITLALCGDIMVGRGIDQSLPHPCNPILHECYIDDARDYVTLAMRRSGEFETPLAYDDIWMAALPTLAAADVRIGNLETSVTTEDDAWPAKGINYRMNPLNVGCLQAAQIDCCGLANNHVLDWGFAGLAETLRTLDGAGLHRAGAGENLSAAAAPAVLEVAGRGRVQVVAVGSPTSGIPAEWAATPFRAGIHWLETLDAAAARRIAQHLRRLSGPNDITVVSVHWGENWGYEIPHSQTEFARALSDEGIDVIHGHSSHHPKAIELRGQSVILYGCGDFLNDYEGISGHEEFRPDLVVLYCVEFALRPRRIRNVRLQPFRIGRLRLNPTTAEETRWLAQRLDEQCRVFGTRVNPHRQGGLEVCPIGDGSQRD